MHQPAQVTFCRLVALQHENYLHVECTRAGALHCKINASVTQVCLDQRGSKIQQRQQFGLSNSYQNTPTQRGKFMDKSTCESPDEAIYMTHIANQF